MQSNQEYQTLNRVFWFMFYIGSKTLELIMESVNSINYTQTLKHETVDVISDFPPNALLCYVWSQCEACTVYFKRFLNWVSMVGVLKQ